MNAEIISIGDELLIGQVINSNASFLGESLSSIGIPVRRVTAVGDSNSDMQQAFARAWSEHDVVVVTGGLGPTHDDITRAAVVEFFGTTLVHSDEALASIETLFARQRRPLLPKHHDQALVPASATVIPNTEGTAPGFHFSEGGRHFFVMPGVPYEMKAMTSSYILPLLERASGATIARTTLMTTGIPESALAARFEGIETLLDNATLAYLPSPAGVRLRMMSRDADAAAAHARVQALRTFIEERAGEYIFAEGATSLEAAVGALLHERKLTIGVAESCTGGLIASLITDVPGSSNWFERGVVTYSNQSKTALLGVDPGLIAAHGAVSREVALAMAEGIRSSAGTSIGIATTGIAGPAGGSEEKPVGLVWIALSAAGTTEAHSFLFGTDRQRTKLRASVAALDMVRRHVLGLPVTPRPLDTKRTPS